MSPDRTHFLKPGIRGPGIWFLSGRDPGRRSRRMGPGLGQEFLLLSLGLNPGLGVSLGPLYPVSTNSGGLNSVHSSIKPLKLFLAHAKGFCCWRACEGWQGQGRQGHEALLCDQHQPLCALAECCSSQWMFITVASPVNSDCWKWMWRHCNQLAFATMVDHSRVGTNCCEMEDEEDEEDEDNAYAARRHLPASWNNFRTWKGESADLAPYVREVHFPVLCVFFPCSFFAFLAPSCFQCVHALCFTIKLI